MVNALTGKVSLRVLCESVKNRVVYYNFMERPAPKEIRSILKPTVIKKVVFDYGLIFEDGFEIRHVDKKYWALFKDKEIIEKRERKL